MSDIDCDSVDELVATILKFTKNRIDSEVLRRILRFKIITEGGESDVRPVYAIVRNRGGGATAIRIADKFSMDLSVRQTKGTVGRMGQAAVDCVLSFMDKADQTTTASKWTFMDGESPEFVYLQCSDCASVCEKLFLGGHTAKTLAKSFGEDAGIYRIDDEGHLTPAAIEYTHHTDSGGERVFMDLRFDTKRWLPETPDDLQKVPAAMTNVLRTALTTCEERMALMYPSPPSSSTKCVIL